MITIQCTDEFYNVHDFDDATIIIADELEQKINEVVERFEKDILAHKKYSPGTPARFYEVIACVKGGKNTEGFPITHHDGIPDKDFWKCRRREDTECTISVLGRIDNKGESEIEAVIFYGSDITCEDDCADEEFTIINKKL